jgi:hypothetical protein
MRPWKSPWGDRWKGKKKREREEEHAHTEREKIWRGREGEGEGEKHKMSGLFREGLLGEGKPSLSSGNFRAEDGICQPCQVTGRD